MKTRYSFDRNQLLALSTVILLVPALRLFPSLSTRLAGGAAWFAVPLALPLSALLMWFFSLLMRRRAEGEGLAELIVRALGKRVGRAALMAMTAWLAFYFAFTLRAGADRFITTVYPNASPPVFTVSMGALALVAALGSARTLVRTAKLTVPMLAVIILPILAIPLFSLKPDYLTPVTSQNLLPVLESSVSAVNVLSISVFVVCFFEGSVAVSDKKPRALFIWMLLMLLLLFWISVDILGSFGAELTMRLTRPFFSLVRNLVLFKTLERLEALVVSLWVFPDFLLSSAILYSAQYCLRLALGCDPKYRGESFRDIKNGRYLIWLIALGGIALSCFLGQSTAKLIFLSETVIPAINLGVIFLFLPAVYLTGRIRKTL